MRRTASLYSPVRTAEESAALGAAACGDNSTEAWAGAMDVSADAGVARPGTISGPLAESAGGRGWLTHWAL